MDPSILPPINAGLNGTALLLLLTGFAFILRKRVQPHLICMTGAMIVSAIFLITYVVHKIMVGGAHTPFGGSGVWRMIYTPMLISHIILAMAVVPLAIFTVLRALRGDFQKHRRIARITFPIWVYVSVTGVLVYFFLYQWFPYTAES